MAILLSLTDFVGGVYNIQNASSKISTTNSSVQETIDAFENKYIYDLLGVTLGDLVIAYIQTASTGNADYDYIIASFAQQDQGLFCRGPIISRGLREYLKACIFYEYTKTSQHNTASGNVKPEAEISTVTDASTTMAKAESMFNRILDTAEAIQMVCSLNKTAYPDYSGARIPVKGHRYFV